MIKDLKKILTINCREATALRSAVLDGHATWSDRWALRLHLLICGGCRRYRRQVLKLRKILQNANARLARGDGLPGITLSDEERERLRRAIK